nr:DUF5946 family protein [Spiractinospora alimapuensis]
MVTCPECGTTSEVPCATLFNRLLALDHSRAEPWGPLHGVAVACYRLQHGSQLPEGSDVLLGLLRVFVDEGAAAAHRFAEGRRRANSHRNRGAARPAYAPTTVSPNGFRVTLADVAADGTFPASGYERRVRDWADATITAWDAVR